MADQHADSGRHWKGMTLRDQVREWRERALEAEAQAERWERTARDTIALADRLAEVIRSGAAGRSLETDSALKAWAAHSDGEERKMWDARTAWAKRDAERNDG